MINVCMSHPDIFLWSHFLFDFPTPCCSWEMTWNMAFSSWSSGSYGSILCSTTAVMFPVLLQALTSPLHAHFTQITFFQPFMVHQHKTMP